MPVRSLWAKENRPDSGPARHYCPDKLITFVCKTGLLAPGSDILNCHLMCSWSENI